MTCPKCKGKVHEVCAVNVSWNETYRQKKCNECGHIFFTVEFEAEANSRFKREWNRYYKKSKRTGR